MPVEHEQNNGPQGKLMQHQNLRQITVSVQYLYESRH